MRPIFFSGIPKNFSNTDELHLTSFFIKHPDIIMITTFIEETDN